MVCQTRSYGGHVIERRLQFISTFRPGPPCHFLIRGWSCKCGRSMSSNSGDEMADHIRDAIAAFLHGMGKGTPTITGTALSTLIDTLKYISHQRSQFTLTETVNGANEGDLIGERLGQCGHRRWGTQDVSVEHERAELTAAGPYHRGAQQ